MHHIYSSHFGDLFASKELDELYVVTALRSFALALIAIFIPVYLIESGFGLVSTIMLIAAIEFAHSVCVVPAAWLASKIGFKHLMLWSMPLLVGYWFLLYSLPQVHFGMLYLVATVVLAGVYRSMYFTGYHLHFAFNGHTGKRGKEISAASIIAQLFRVAGPLTGGIIIAQLGFSSLFVLSSILLLMAVIPLVASKDAREHFTLRLRGAEASKRARRYWLRDAASFLGYGFENAANGVAWPLLLFLGVVSSEIALGGIATVGLLFSVMATMFIGKRIDGNKKKVLRWGAIAKSALWFVRSLVSIPIHAYATDVLYGATNSATIIPIDALSYDKAGHREHMVRYIVFRETIINFCAGVGTLLLAVLSLKAGLVFAGATTLLYLFF